MGSGRGDTHLLSLQYWIRYHAKLHTGRNDQVSGDTACNYQHGDQTTGFADRENLQTHLIAVFVLLSLWNNLSSVVAMVNSLAALVSGWGPLKWVVFSWLFTIPYSLIGISTRYADESMHDHYWKWVLPLVMETETCWTQLACVMQMSDIFIKEHTEHHERAKPLDI